MTDDPRPIPSRRDRVPAADNPPSRTSGRNGATKRAARKAPGANWNVGADPIPDAWTARFAKRRACIERSAKKDLIPDALAMCTLDELTDPATFQAKQPSLAKAIRDLTTYLTARVVQRASWVLRGLPFEPLAADDERQRSCAKTVEKQFRKAMQKAFPSPVAGLPFNIRLFERVFARFVAGEIQTRTLTPDTEERLAYDGIPDGTNFFAFAEAVLLFVRLDLEPDFWLPTLRSFVCGSAFFAANYWDGRTRSLSAYSCKHFEPNASSAAIQAMTRQFFGARELPLLARAFGEIVATALRDEERLIHPTPNLPEFR